MAAERTVGVRELKANLSRYLRLVKEGETVTVSERGKPVARLTPVSGTLEERLQVAIAAGLIKWGGQELEPRKPTIRTLDGGMVSDMIVEDRDWFST